MMRLPSGIAVAGEPVRIAVAVPALVLVADDASHGAHARDRAQDPLADRRVLAHDLPLALVERPGLVQDLVGDADLADVVEQRRGADATDLLAASASASPTLRGQVDDALRMLARVAVALLERRGERRDHVAVPETRAPRRRSSGEPPKTAACRPPPARACSRAALAAASTRLGLLPGLQRRDPHRRRDAPDPARLEVLELDQDSLDRLHRGRRRRSRAAGARTRRRPSGRRDRGPGSARRSGGRPRPAPRRRRRSHARG